MKLTSLINDVGEWLKEIGSDSDVVISSRVRLARNLTNFVFLTNADEATRQEIEKYIREKLESAKLFPPNCYFNLSEINDLDRKLLTERYLISMDHASGKNARGVIFNHSETTSIMINEEDHLRIQIIRGGLQLINIWEEINELDTKLEKHFSYAFSPQFGYLTACPTNVGTGLRASVMLHLPALSFVKQLEKVFQALARIKYTIRGFAGESTPAMSEFFQVSNQTSLGKSEKEIITELQNVIPEIIKYERTWRTKLLNDSTHRLSDRINRAYGILKYVQSISSEEAMDLLSMVRLGIHLKLIKSPSLQTINNIFIMTQPAHLQKMNKHPLTPVERDVFRATFIRDKFNTIETTSNNQNIA